MQQTDRPAQFVRFGAYEADLRSGELRKNGLKLKLSGQPFQVLALLLERAGDVVTREEIQKRLWPADTFVDFDHGLNTAINKIRETLGDAADNPRFVETLPRRGYRFIAPVEGITLGASRPLPKVRLDGQLGDEARAPLQGRTNARKSPRGTRQGLRLASVLTILVVGAAVAWYVWQRLQPVRELKQRQLTTNSSELAVLASAISPDGRYLAYSDGGGIHLRVIDTAETHGLPTPKGSRIDKLAWFPEGNKLLASGEAGEPRVSSLWTISILGGPPQKLRDDAADGSVFQNGGGVVFVTGEGKEIWQMSPEGEEARKLMIASKGEYFATPVVVEGRLWYARGYVPPALPELLSYNVESCDLQGGPRTILISDLAGAWTGALLGTPTALLLPNGRFIYSQWEARNLFRGFFRGGSLWAIQADLRSGHASGKPRRIVDWPDFKIASLSATADGKRLALVKEQSVESVYVADLEGNGSRIVNPQRLTLSDSSDHAYAWTPDSKSVLFDSDRNGTWDVFKQALDQRTAEQLVASPGSMRPAMSPDGVSVLYLTNPPPSRIMRAALTGGPPQSLGDIQDYGEIRCALTANLCVVSEPGPKQEVLYSLYPVKGKGREPLSTGPLHPGQESDWDVSPDGSSLAFLTGDAQKGALQIQIRPLAGGAGRELNINGWGNPDSIRWSADGKGWLVTTWLTPRSDETSRTPVEWHQGGWALLKVDPSGKAQQLMRGSIWGDAIPSPDGRHVALMGQVMTSNVWMLENF